MQAILTKYLGAIPMFGIQVSVKVKSDPVKYVWRDVHPVGGKPYRYETRKEAEDMARICYGPNTFFELTRVIEIGE